MRRFVVGVAILAIASLASQSARADDQAIAQSILRRLKAHQDQGKLKDFDLDLVVEDGTVWLNGRVASDQQQQLAIDAARRAQGVKKVINALKKQATDRSAAIQDPAPRPAEDAADGPSRGLLKAAFAPSLFTTGTPIPSDSASAPAAPREASSTKETEDRKPMNMVDHKQVDKRIADSIVADLKKLQDQGQLKGFDLDLYVDKGTVWMKGTVANARQRTVALDIARRTAGVHQVVNDLKLTTARDTGAKADDSTARLISHEQPITRASGTPNDTEAPRDKQVIRDIKSRMSQLQSQGQLKGFGVKMHSTEGVVWLKGHASSAQQLSLILETVRRTPGVTKVVNEIGIRPQTVAQAAPAATISRPPSPAAPRPAATRPAEDDDRDQAIVDGIAETLRHYKSQGMLEGFGIDLHSENGLVTISGEVSTPAQRQLAADIARRTTGVRQVVNGLRVSAIGMDTLPGAPATAPAIAPPEAQSTKPQPIPAAAEPIPSAETPPPAAIAAASAPIPAEPQQLLPIDAATIARQQQMAQYQAYAAAYAQAYGQPNQGAPVDQTPRPLNPIRTIGYAGMAAVAAPVAIGHAIGQVPARMMAPPTGPPVGAVAPARYDHPQMPAYAWPSYASHPNYAAVTYPRQHAASAWPYIGPFYPYPQVPLGWRKVTLEWDDGWWMLDFKEK